ncbi:hypothetical protein RIF29_40045 [Crotalaria pallida]|uniref:inorganic diphosphatase n=1 Tax=Crotalaria pallida TaxID=3830 RepID=A0AAN9E2X4_CROPI
MGIGVPRKRRRLKRGMRLSGVKQIGERQRKIGEVLRVKPLAALAMIDERELDRKIVAILLNDPKASLVNDVDDVEKHVHTTSSADREKFEENVRCLSIDLVSFTYCAR